MSVKIQPNGIIVSNKPTEEPASSKDSGGEIRPGKESGEETPDIELDQTFLSEKFMKMKMGEMILNAVVKQTEESREKILEEADKRRTDAWNEERLRQWQPAASKSVVENLKDLKNLFTLLYGDIMSITEGKEQLLLLNELNKLINSALDKLVEKKFQVLADFLVQNGQYQAAANIKTSLLEIVTGKLFLNPEWQRALNTLFSEQGISVQKLLAGTGGMQKADPLILDKLTAPGVNEFLKDGLRADGALKNGVKPDKIGIHRQYPDSNRAFGGRKDGTGGKVSHEGVYKAEAQRSAVPGNLKGNMPQLPPGLSNKRAMAQGMIYSPSGKGTVFVPKSYEDAVETSAARSIASNPKGEAQGKNAAVNTGDGVVFKNSSVKPDAQNRIFTPYDLEEAGRFAKHFKEDPLPRFRADAAVENEELLGVDIAIKNLKSEIFASNSGVSSEMGGTIKAAVGQYIFNYLFDINNLLKTQAYQIPGDTKAYEPINKKSVFRIFNYIMEEYKKTDDPGEAIKKGARLAYEIFSEKAGSRTYSSIYRYRKEAGFWDNLFAAGGQCPNDVKTAVDVIKKNWNQFIKELELSYNPGLQFPRGTDNLSNWGVLVPGNKKALDYGRESAPAVPILWVMLFIIIVLCCFAFVSIQNGNNTQAILAVGAGAFFAILLIVKGIRNREK